MRESDLAKHLSNDREEEAARQQRDELEEQIRLIAQEKRRKPLEYGGQEDFQLKQALNHLQGLPVQLAKQETKLVARSEPRTKPID